MRGKNIIFVLVVFLFVFAGCEDDYEYRIDETVSTEVSRPLSDMTKQMNDARLGSVLVEGDYSYFGAFEKKGEEIYSRLYKKNRHSGEMICLVERKAAAKVDVFYSSLYLKGDYLYFMLFDATTLNTPEDLRGVLCRVRVDGSVPFEIMIKPDEYEPRTSIFGDKAYFACSYNYGFILKCYNLEQGKLEELFFKDDMDATDGRIYYSFEFIYKDYAYYSVLDGVKRFLYRCRLDGSDDKLIFNYSSLYGNALVDNDRLYINDIVGENLYAADLDGSNEELLLRDVLISNMNIYDGTLYFCMFGSDSYQAGIYEYQPGYKMPLPLYKGEVIFGPMIDSFGGIWCTLPTQDIPKDVVRLGQLHKLDVKSQTWQPVL